MRDFWGIGLSGAALYLRHNGFSWQQADRLLQLKLRYERGAFHEVTDEQKRAEFAKWLVRHGHLTDRLDHHGPETGRDTRAA